MHHRGSLKFVTPILAVVNDVASIIGGGAGRGLGGAPAGRVRQGHRRAAPRARARGPGPPRGRRRRRAARALRVAEREEISRGLAAADSGHAIAARLGCPPSTITREVARNGGAAHYRAAAAERAAQQRAARPQAAKLATTPRLRRLVARLLRRRWSPEQIAHWLAAAYPHDGTMRVSHETIYRSLFVQGRGALRTRRAARRPRRAQPTGRGRLRDVVPISARPAEVADRAVPDHWEGDLLLGQRGSAVATLVERTTRFLLLVRLPGGLKAEPVAAALRRAVRRLPVALTRSLTWDQGKELAAHVAFTVATGVQVYFCDPRSPWQRGSNENTNGLLRQYLPRTRDFRTLSQRQFDRIARELNTRPRETLGWQTPAARFATLEHEHATRLPAAGPIAVPPD
jgi:IS30 family transposase